MKEYFTPNRNKPKKNPHRIQIVVNPKEREDIESYCTDKNLKITAMIKELLKAKGVLK